MGLACHQQEDRVAPAVGVELAGLDEWLEETWLQMAAASEIVTHARQQTIIPLR